MNGLLLRFDHRAATAVGRQSWDVIRVEVNTQTSQGL